ncbi:class II aldolase/adducin family protein [Arthrobacter sp. 35/47]|uniref:class II aldolase/adducin family protein n=1 Tax=Arthrobacter sp. 35/47 TaxID=269454 RepID=UPI0004799C60|nr:class II aldolase/adducin family protein [Arthrobacter sp. 35/47]
MTANEASADARAAIVQASQLLFTAGVMSHSGHGNLSARIDDDRFLLTSTGVVRDLRPEQLATVTVGGDVVDGELGPENAEIIHMHSVVYNTRDDIAAIIHTHSPAATAFAVANASLPCRTEPLLRFGQAQTVPVVPWGPRGSDLSVKGITRVLAEQPGTNAVLLGNHGLLAFGPDPVATGRLVIAIEESAAAELAAAALGGAVDFPPGALDAVRAGMKAGQH